MERKKTKNPIEIFTRDIIRQLKNKCKLLLLI